MNLEEIKKLYEECEQNVDALAFEMAIPVAELLARGENEAADKLDKENRANLEDFMRNHVGGLCDTDVFNAIITAMKRYAAEKCDELKQDIAEFYSDECR